MHWEAPSHGLLTKNIPSVDWGGGGGEVITRPTRVKWAGGWAVPFPLLR